METNERERKKIIPLAMIKILEEYTDNNHALEMAELKELIKKVYGINVDRRTVYSTVHLLNEFGYNICYGHPYEGSLERGYYVASRELSENDCESVLKAIKRNKNYESEKSALLKHFSKYQKLNIEYQIGKK